MAENEVKMATLALSFYYHRTKALDAITLDILSKKITAVIGPSGCGKSTFLRCLNRMNDVIEGIKVEGKVLLDGVNIYDAGVDPVEVRRRVGMVFQKSNPFPKSVFDNVAYGLRINGLKNKKKISERVEKALYDSALWDEVKDRLHAPALSLSGGQQQRLCIARALAVEPAVILMDEPASALDPVSTLKIEDLIQQLEKTYTIVIVTHNMQEAARVSDYTAFLYEGKLIEYGPTTKIFTNPVESRTQDYITGRFG